MPHPSPNLRRSAIALAVATCAVSAAMADMVPFTENASLSTSGLGSFSGTLTYTYLGSGNGRLDVAMTNTTRPDIGGFITAFMFRVPESMGAVSSSLATWDNGVNSNIPSGTNAPPFPGTWIGGAGVAPDWLSHGAVHDGIGVGSTGHWSFNISGENASLLSAASFIYDSVNLDPYAFIVRFRGMALQPDGSDSDKVPGRDVPAPGAAALVGLAGLLSRRRRS